MARPAGFRPSEWRIVVLLSEEGLCQEEIARRLFISDGTVKCYLSKIYRRVNIPTKTSGRSQGQTHLVRWYWKRKYDEAISNGLGLS